MFITDYIHKQILVNNQNRGVCLGIGFSLKTQAVKHLLCAPTAHQKPTFAVSIFAVQSVTEHLTLRRLRAVLPNSCARLTIGTPVYSYEGDFLGKVMDAEIQNGALLHIFIDGNKRFPATAVFACNDALILRKNQPYPLGQRVPAPVLCQINEKTDGLVTRPLLRKAIQQGTLIKLTLSLPPFDIAN